MTKIRDPKVQLVLAMVFGLLGALQLCLYWDGLMEWIRICSLSYVEVEHTPFVSIWTSGRGVAGIFFAFAALVFLSNYMGMKKLDQD